MLIDYFTVGAQVVNFFILVWLMKRYLYKPILNAIDERERKIAAELADAGRSKAEAQVLSDEFKRRNDEFESHRAALVAGVEGEAVQLRERLLGEVRGAAAAQALKQKEELLSQGLEQQKAIRLRAQHEVFAIARRVLGDLSNADLEARMCEVFIGRLRGMEGSAREVFGAALKATGEPVLVRSAFELRPGLRGEIEKALAETFPGEKRLRFETAPGLVGGIELTANGQKISWSISGYLASLEEGVAELVDRRTEAKAHGP